MKYEQSATTDISDQEKAFRTAISNDPVLNYFLEKGSIRPNATFAEATIYPDPAFLAFISPYFKEAYVNAVIRAFDMKDTSLMSDIAMNTILLDNAHRKQAFNDILVYLEQRKAVLESFHSKLQARKHPDIHHLAEHTSIAVICNLNYLPAEFLAFRSAYARVAMKVINALIKQDLPIAMDMITDLRQLTVDVRTSHEVDALYKRLNKANQQTRVSKNSSGNSSASNASGGSGKKTSNVLSFVIGIIIVILFAIFEIFFCDDRGYHSHHSYHPSYRSYRR